MIIPVNFYYLDSGIAVATRSLTTYDGTGTRSYCFSGCLYV